MLTRFKENERNTELCAKLCALTVIFFVHLGAPYAKGRAPCAKGRAPCVKLRAPCAKVRAPNSTDPSCAERRAPCAVFLEATQIPG